MGVDSPARQPLRLAEAGEIDGDELSRIAEARPDRVPREQTLRPGAEEPDRLVSALAVFGERDREAVGATLLRCDMDGCV